MINSHLVFKCHGTKLFSLMLPTDVAAILSKF